MDISAVTLNKIIVEKNLEVWSKLKLLFLDPAYATIYTIITKYYEKYNAIPSFEELKLVVRDSNSKNILPILESIDYPDINAEVALEALIDKFTQDQAVILLDKFVDKLPLYDHVEIKENLANIVLTLDDKTLQTSDVYNMSDMLLFKSAEDIDRERVYLGLNNTFDNTLNGVSRQELILIGGRRGSGKTITANNIVVNQYEAGKTVVMFTIEMTAHEIMERNQSILADVPYLDLKRGTLSPENMLKVIKSRASMFEDSSDLVEEYLRTKDKYKFEAALVKTKTLKRNNQIILIDDRALTLTSVDLHLGKLKSRFGDNLTVCVVDYLNQIVLEGTSGQYDWQPQITIAKKLKDLARKHEVVMLSPYQIDSTGEARFAKGILDSADISLIMEPNDKKDSAITYNTTKIRNGPPITFTSGIDWETLRISPINVDLSKDTEEDSKKSKPSKKPKEAVTDTPPWN